MAEQDPAELRSFAAGIRLAARAGALTAGNAAAGATLSDIWLTSLRTETLQAGWELAIKRSRMSVKATQPHDEIRGKLRAAYDQDTAQLIAASQVIATNVQTVAAANKWWR